MKNVYCISTEQHGDMKSGVLRSKTQPSHKLGVLVHCLARTCESLTIPTDTLMQLLCTFFVAATVKLQEFVINEPDYSPSEQGSN